MKSDNELIAEFMGHDVPNEYLNGSSLNNKYDTSWDWLMPVVEKIQKEIDVNSELRTWTIYNRKYRAVLTKSSMYKTCDGEGDTLIEAVYKAVVEFIKSFDPK